MGRRTRKRADDGVPATPRRHAEAEEAPKAPWHPVPLVELSVLAGIVLIVLGFTNDGEDRLVLLVGGFALASVAGLEVSVREHFGGYRSHTTLLSAFSALLVAVPLWFTPLPQEAILAVAVIVGALVFRALRNVFADRAGGLSWRA